MAKRIHVFLPMFGRDNAKATGHIVGLNNGDRCLRLLRITPKVRQYDGNAANDLEADLYTLNNTNPGDFAVLQSTVSLGVQEYLKRFNITGFWAWPGKVITSGGFTATSPFPSEYDEQLWGVFGAILNLGDNFAAFNLVLDIEGVWEKPSQATSLRHALAVKSGINELGAAESDGSSDLHLPH